METKMKIGSTQYVLCGIPITWLYAFLCFYGKPTVLKNKKDWKVSSVIGNILIL